MKVGWWGGGGAGLAKEGKKCLNSYSEHNECRPYISIGQIFKKPHFQSLYHVLLSFVLHTSVLCYLI